MTVDELQRRYEELALGRKLPVDLRRVYATVADDLWFVLHDEWKDIYRKACGFPPRANDV